MRQFPRNPPERKSGMKKRGNERIRTHADITHARLRLRMGVRKSMEGEKEEGIAARKGEEEKGEEKR